MKPRLRNGVSLFCPLRNEINHSHLARNEGNLYFFSWTLGSILGIIKPFPEIPQAQAFFAFYRRPFSLTNSVLKRF